MFHRRKRIRDQAPAGPADLLSGLSAGSHEEPGTPRPAPIFRGLPDFAINIAWSADGNQLAATGYDPVMVWEETEEPSELLNRDRVVASIGLAWHPSRPTLAIGYRDGMIMLRRSGERRLENFLDIGASVQGLAWSSDGGRLAATDIDGNVSIWDALTRDRIAQASMKSFPSNRVQWSDGDEVLVTCSNEGVVTVHDAADGLRTILETKTTSPTRDFDVSNTGVIAVAAEDCAIRVIDKNRSMNVLEGALTTPTCVRFTPDSRFLAALTSDRVLIWRCRDWEPVARFEIADSQGNYSVGFGGLDFHPTKPLVAVKNTKSNRIDCYRIDYSSMDGADIQEDSRRYVNAKVVLLGDTGVGKSGLGLVLSGQGYRPTDSTHGRNVWTFDSTEIVTPGAGTQTREVLLWDLAGQPGYRLVHQLHLNEVAVALIVFDSRSETDPFSGVKHWVRALAQARRLEGNAAIRLRTFLVAARADRGGVPVTQQRIRAMLGDFGLDGFFETSAKEGWDVNDLAEAIRGGIDWDSLPIVSSNALFESIRQFLLEEKESGRLLSTTGDLFHSFKRANPDIDSHDDDLQLSFKACIGRIESRGLIRRLHFGDLVLLQPELLDSYASGMVQAAKEEPDGLGFIPEEEALTGRFRLAESERIANREQEKLLLIATVEELLRHEIALKEITDQGVDLIFPSQFTRERPDAPDIPGRQVVFTFDGPLRSIYASLAVRLAHSALFKRRDMWQDAASYTASDGGICGIHLRELEEGRGELALFHDGRASSVVFAQFETYVHEYLGIRALSGTVRLRRIHSCPNCEYVLDDAMVRLRLARGVSTIHCPVCDQSTIPLTGDEPVAPNTAAVAEMNRSADLRREENIAATRLQGKIKTKDFDVFLCYSSEDREQVESIANRLKERGILPWLDVWQMQPGTRWITELEKQLKSVKSAAVFVGPSGPGPWQSIEVETILNQPVGKERRIIPVILEGRQGTPPLPELLGLWHRVDMRKPDPDPFEQLVWGITGEPPSGTG